MPSSAVSVELASSEMVCVASTVAVAGAIVTFAAVGTDTGQPASMTMPSTPARRQLTLNNGFLIADDLPLPLNRTPKYLLA